MMAAHYRERFVSALKSLLDRAGQFQKLAGDATATNNFTKLLNCCSKLCDITASSSALGPRFPSTVVNALTAKHFSELPGLRSVLSKYLQRLMTAHTRVAECGQQVEGLCGQLSDELGADSIHTVPLLATATAQLIREWATEVVQRCGSELMLKSSLVEAAPATHADSEGARQQLEQNLALWVSRPYVDEERLQTLRCMLDAEVDACP